MAISIGEIIYLLNSNPPKLIPGKVIEQIITRKMSGEHIKHVVEFSKGKTYTLEKLEKPWFSSIEEARNYLESEASKLIDHVVLEGSQRADLILGKQNSSVQQTETSVEIQEISGFQDKIQDDAITVDLGDGKVAKVSLPEVLK